MNEEQTTVWTDAGSWYVHQRAAVPTMLTVGKILHSATFVNYYIIAIFGSLGT